jgi:integrase
MASAVKDKSGNFLVAFRWAGRQYTKSLRTRNPKKAEAGVQRVETTLSGLKQGWLTIPEDADPGEFIISGGTRTAKPTPATPAEGTTLGDLFDRWREGAKKRSNTLRTILIHQEHVKRILGEKRALPLEMADLRAYCEQRATERGKRGLVRPYTIRKELRTLRQAWQWGHRLGIAPAPAWRIADLELEPDRGREPFRTFAEIERRIKRGGLSEEEQARLWECLYLTAAEVADVLEHVRANARAPWFYPLMTFCALTGARRAEMLRSRIDDWDFENGVVHIRELKRDKSKEFTMRAVDIHPRLAEVMRGWLANHPGGQFTIAKDGGPVSVDDADSEFDRVLGDHKEWGKIRGFHTFRHSFASILASKGQDQRVIDALMGHQTEEMRRRYQHLFPKAKRRAVDSLLGYPFTGRG